MSEFEFRGFLREHTGKPFLYVPDSVELYICRACLLVMSNGQKAEFRASLLDAEDWALDNGYSVTKTRTKADGNVTRWEIKKEG